MSELLVIARLGKPSLQVRVVRINARRRAQVARALSAAGYPGWAIRHVVGLSRAGLARALAAKPAATLWGSFAAQIQAELRNAA